MENESKSYWAELIFPPINLYNVWKTKEWSNYHASLQDIWFWEQDDDDGEELDF